MLFPVRGQWARPTNERRDGRSPDSPIDASRPPSRSSLQWLMGRKLPAYSCGYSLGIPPSSLLAVLWTAPSGRILGTSARRCQLALARLSQGQVSGGGGRVKVALSGSISPRHPWRGSNRGLRAYVHYDAGYPKSGLRRRRFFPASDSHFLGGVIIWWCAGNVGPYRQGSVRSRARACYSRSTMV